MKNKSKSFIIPWIIFPFETMVCLGMKQEEVLKVLDKYDLTEEDKEHVVMEGTGRTVIFSGNGTLLWLKEYPDPGSGVLAHECFHVVFFLLDKIQITIGDTNDELVAYMLQYLIDEIYKKM